MIHISGHRENILSDSGVSDFEGYFSVNCCGYEKYITKNTRTLREKGRLDYQLIYMVRGTGRFLVDDNMVDIPRGNIIIFHPGEVQQYAYQYSDTPELYWVHFTGSGAQEYLNKVGLLHKRVHLVGIHNTCIEYFKKIIYELQLKSYLYEQLADAALMELLAFMGRKKIDAEKYGTGSMDTNIQNIIEQMHLECGRQWSINEMAKSCLLSPNRFMHRFKEQTGLSANNYLIKIRLDKARDLLLSTSLSIKEISNIIGYENALYFSRLFSKTEGVSPREYRKRQ